MQEKQADENARYRDCVEKLTPLFLDKFANAPTLPKSKVPSKESSFSLSNLSGIWTDGTMNYDIQLQGENKKLLIYNDYYYVYGLKLVDAVISGDSLITTIEDINSRRHSFIFTISTPVKMTLKERIFSNSGNELWKISGEHIGQLKLNNLISVLRMDFEKLRDEDISGILRQLQPRCEGGQGGACVEVRNLRNIQATREARHALDKEILKMQEDLQRTEECRKSYGRNIMDARWDCGSVVEIKQKLSMLQYQRMETAKFRGEPLKQKGLRHTLCA